MESPTATVHHFTAASDYNAARESGCTNSGEGCHGSESSYQNFNAYHPDVACTSCHEYQGVGCIPCHSPKQHECASCHDGTMANASDAVRLADPYPRGHYRETTHTAMGTDMDTLVRAADGGKAAADCDACHSRDLAKSHTGVPVNLGSPYGSDIGCGECHNDVRVLGMAVVLSDWKNRACEDCHTLDSEAPMHSASVAPSVESSGTGGCASTGSGCHDVDDLHALHPDEPQTCSGNAKEGEPGCHDLTIESHAPTARTCGDADAGACHGAYANADYGHAKDAEVHSSATRGPMRDTSFMEIACGSCHDMAPDGRSLVREHSLGTSAGSGGNVCRGCHNNAASAPAVEGDWDERDGAGVCSVCHDGAGLPSAHAGGFGGHVVTTGSKACASSGAGCHPTNDLSAVGDPGRAGALHADCLTCHDRTAAGGNRSFDPESKTCGSGRACHGDVQVSSAIHGTGVGAVGGSDPLHTASSDQAESLLIDRASGVSIRCGACHSMVLGSEHSRPNSVLAAGDICRGCHNSSDGTAAIVKTGWSARATTSACTGCHADAAPAPHQRIDSVHTATQIGRSGAAEADGCARPGCHPGADVRVLHAAVGCDVAGCHTASGDIRGRRTLTCGGEDSAIACHAGPTRHADQAIKHQAAQIDYRDQVSETGCVRAGCHATADVRTLHKTTHCSTAGCHVEGGPTLMGCGGKDGDPACHINFGGSTGHVDVPAKHQATEYAPDGTPQPGACQRSGCHSTVDVRSIHPLRCSTPACHVDGGPTYMSCGGADGDERCHVSFSGTEHFTDHDASIEGTLGAIFYGPGENVGCLGTCHATDLRDEHRLRYLAGDMEGGGATYCRVCHAGTVVGERGAYSTLVDVKAAIVAGDRRCVSCHSSAGDGPNGVIARCPCASRLPLLRPVSTRSERRAQRLSCRASLSRCRCLRRLPTARPTPRR